MIKKALIAATFLVSSTTASAAVVALYGNNYSSYISSFLTQNGHTVIYSGTATADPAALNGVDAVILMRTTGTNAVKDFVLNGGLLITEWDAAEWALNTAHLIDGVAANGKDRGDNRTVFQTDEALALGLGERGVGSQYADGDRTQYMYEFSGLGAGVNALGKLNDGTVVSVGGAAGDGYVLANGTDWGDHFEANGMNHVTGQWLLNALDMNYRQPPVPPVPGAVSEPAIPALFGLGLTALFISGQRRRKQKGN